MRIGRAKARNISDLIINQDIPMGTHKLTGLGEGVANGQSLRREQVIGVFLQLAGGTMAGELKMGANKITGLPDPTAGGEAARKTYVDDLIATCLLLAGGTMTGDLVIGAHRIKTTNLLLKQGIADRIYIRDLADENFKDIELNNLMPHNIIEFKADAGAVAAPNTDGQYLMFKARDTGHPSVEVARLQGAADPYFQMTLPMVLNPFTGDLPAVEGMFGYDGDDDLLKYRDGTATRQVPRVVTGSYDGDDADDRQIATGMKCSMVIINPSGLAGAWVMIPGVAWKMQVGDKLTGGTGLHGTDGFTVYNTTDIINTTGTTYSYWAISE